MIEVPSYGQKRPKVTGRRANDRYGVPEHNPTYENAERLPRRTKSQIAISEGIGRFQKSTNFGPDRVAIAIGAPRAIGKRSANLTSNVR